MVTSEVHRTLVKSPPELWSELSDAAALGRHLADLGEIRITRLEPETAIEWETDSARGRVQLEASGWGTRVTLSASGVAAEPPADTPDPPAADSEADLDEAEDPTASGGGGRPLPPTDAGAPPPAAQAQPEASEEDDAAPSDEIADVEDPFAALLARATAQRLGADRPGVDPLPRPGVGRRQGLIARVLWWRRRSAAAPVPASPAIPGDAVPASPAILRQEPIPPEMPPSPVAEGPPPAPAPVLPEALAWAGWVHAPARRDAELDSPAQPRPEGELSGETESPPAPDLAAEIQAAEQAGTEDVTAVLTKVLDTLGSAHHRPFSRA